MSYLPPPLPPPRKSSHPPMAASIAPVVSVSRPGVSRKVLVFSLVGSAILVLCLVLGAFMYKRSAASVPENSVVRVTVGHSHGSGFFVAPPKGEAGVFVVTAFHVIDSGEPIIIERVVHSSSKETYVEAYPETELAAYDANNDLAILRIKRLPTGKVSTLRLSDHADKDEALVSMGFPASSLTSQLGLVKKDGKVLELVKLSAVDSLYHRVVRENSIDGMIVSNDLEPGFSGGPTCNAHGEVVGVNLLKDSAYRGQNGIVSSHVVADLLSNMKKSSASASAPAAEEVEDLLKNIQEQDLLLPLGDRSKILEHEMVALDDLPRLRDLIGEIRRMDQDGTERDLGDGKKASSRALLGILLARLPGKSLETYSAASTQSTIHGCEDHSRNLRRFVGESTSNDDDAECERFAIRPLAWDLTAVTLEWSGSPRTLSVTKIEEVDSDANVYRASVHMSGLPSLIPVYVARQGGKLRLELFAKNGWLHALEGSRGAVGHDYEGSWTAKQERRADAKMSGVDESSEEHLSIAIHDSDSVTISHRLASARFGAHGGIFSCNHRPSISTSAENALSGKLQNGVIVGGSSHEGAPDSDCKACGLCSATDRLFVLKRNGDKLLMYRTNGSASPDVVEFSRD